LIVNKRSNTIFLRKYHKKYNESWSNIGFICCLIEFSL
jgi:hypothetical protein